MQSYCKQANGDLLAGRNNNVIFTGIMARPDFTAPLHKLVCCTRHRRHHHSHFVSGINFRLHTLCNSADTVKISNRSAPEFLNDTCHFTPTDL
uniref:Uncharacterized protein n=1 Tax=uncultured alpha proteobacterium EB000_37G09 TaxID=710792 RepID=E0XZH0_9PROT|nr:hypothetical protein [uncultured alpha proteobacterium EB000_37G09]